MCSLADYLPVTRKQMEDIVSHLDEVLNEIADKLDAGIDNVLKHVAALEEELKAGHGVRPETVARLKDAAESLHTTVDEEITEENEGSESEPEE